MSRRLDSQTAESLVREALRLHGKIGTSAHVQIGDLIESKQEREAVRATIVTLVHAHKFKIEADAIPVHAQTTLGQISDAVLLAALPGGTEHPESESGEPNPPAPDETAGKPKQELHKKRFEEIG